jgi:transcription initiation factor TFIIIB Brf1 subunit/transcription initiation factor TFIIB
VGEDRNGGHLICFSCGEVQQAGLISQERERIFADDDKAENKKRTNTTFRVNEFSKVAKTNSDEMAREEKSFLDFGLDDIRKGLDKLLDGGINLPVLERAQEIFQKGYRLQVLEKKGLHATSRDVKTELIKLEKARQKFSKRKQLVVAAIYKALREELLSDSKRFTVQIISNAVEGKHVVSDAAVRLILKELREESEHVE